MACTIQGQIQDLGVRGGIQAIFGEIYIFLHPNNGGIKIYVNPPIVQMGAAENANFHPKKTVIFFEVVITLTYIPGFRELNAGSGVAATD
jgi:hypothetical protein